MFAASFADMCVQTIIWEPTIGRNQYGKPAYGTPVVFTPPAGGRRVFKITRVKAYERGVKGQGAEMVSESQIWIMALPDVHYEDKMYVMGDDPSTAPPILSFERYPDETGQDQFMKVLLGSSNG
jgi:hypothetical protein